MIPLSFRSLKTAFDRDIGPGALSFVLSFGLCLAGCTSGPSRPSSLDTLREDLPLTLNHPEGITELLDGVVVGSELVAVGDGGTIIHSTDSGQTWEKSDVPVQSTLTGVSFAADAQHGWAVGHDALILASADGGRTWQKQWQGENRAAWFLDVHALDEHRAVAVGKNGLYVETSDGGATWIRRKLIEQDFDLNRISRGPSGTLYLAGEHGTALRSTDRGVDWTQLDIPADHTLSGILPVDSHTLIAYGGSMSGNIYRSGDDGQTWVAVRLVPRKLLLKTALITHDGSILLAGISGDWREDGFRGFFFSRDGARSFGPWPFAPSRVKDQSKSSALVNLIELIQAPDGSLVALGTEGATIVGRSE